MSSIQVDIRGVKPVADLLARLPRRMVQKHARRANRQSAVFVRDAVRRAAPDDPATKGRALQKYARVKSRRGKRTYVRSSVYYPTAGGPGDPKNAYYWRFVEYGTRNQAANPYIQRAAISQFRRVQRHQFMEFRRGIAAEVRKARSQGAKR